MKILFLLMLAVAAAKSEEREPLIVFTFVQSSVRLEKGKLINDPSIKSAPSHDDGFRFLLNGKDWLVSPSEWKTGADWVKSHSVVSRIKVAKGVLSLDGNPIDLGNNSKVMFVTEAVPWCGGILAVGRTLPKKTMGSFRFLIGLLGWNEKAHSEVNEEMMRTIEPCCAIFIDPKSRSGSDLQLCGKIQASMVALFPPPNLVTAMP